MRLCVIHVISCDCMCVSLFGLFELVCASMFMCMLHFVFMFVCALSSACCICVILSVRMYMCVLVYANVYSCLLDCDCE